MEPGGMQCHGCGSTNVQFDPKRRILICNQCGKEEYYSRATLNANGKVLYARQNALSFFSEGRYDTARQYAQEVLNISVDNAPALYILSYHDEFKLGKNGILQRFFQKMDDLALEYDEVKELMSLFLASPLKLLDYEEDVIKVIAGNMQAEEDASVLCAFFDKICPYFISKWPSIAYFRPSLAEMYAELAGHCGIPKTCFALINAIQANPESPYSKNNFFLKQNAIYFYQNFVTPIGTIISAMKDNPMKSKFVAVYQQRRQQFEHEINNR